MTTSDPFTWWASKMKLARDGELDGTPPPPVRPGVDLRSVSRTYEGGSKPAGGLVIDCFGASWRCVDRYHGRDVHYWTIAYADVNWSIYSGDIRPDAIAELVKLLHEDSARHGADHLHALLRLSAVLAQGGA